MSNATIDQLTRINTVYVQTIREQDARIASLEAQLAAAQERERDFAEWVWQAVYHEQREAGEFRDDAKAEADRVVARIRGEVADEVAAALAAAQKGTAPASDGEQPEGGREGQ